MTIRTRVASALNILLGLSEDHQTGSKWKVTCRPEAWRCSLCGGGFVRGPNGRPLVHFHANNDRVPATRYVGLREHSRRVWRVLWGNRPRLVRDQPRASYGAPSDNVIPLRPRDADEEGNFPGDSA